jgi:hypothetical protein
VISLALQALVGSREDIVVIHPSLLRKWISNRNNNGTRNQLGWYFRPVHKVAAVDPEERDVWDTPVPKTVLLYLPHNSTTGEILAVCTVETSICSVLLYGAGSQERELQNALKDSEEQLRSMLSQILAKDAGRYAWWDRKQQGHFEFRIFSRSEKIVWNDGSAPGLHLLDVVIRILAGSFADLLLFGRLSGTQLEYVPPEANSLDFEEVRRLCTRKLFFFLGSSLGLRRSPRQKGQKTNQDEPELDSEPAESTAFDAEVEAAEIETELEGDEQEDEFESPGLKEEVVAAIDEELADLTAQAPGLEASIDGLSTVLDKFRDGLPHYSEDEIQQRVDDLSKRCDKAEYEITVEDEEKLCLKAGPAPEIKFQSGMLHSGQLCVNFLTH